jgi:alginate O-acetyltransferase complex protein AlgI
MQYTGKLYFAFLIAVFYCYWFLPERGRWRVALLAAASYVIYALGGFVALSILFGVSTISFGTAWLMSERSPKARKLLLIVAVSVDLGTLGFFKYWNFLIDSSPQWLRTTGLLQRLHLNLIVPIGISFLIFQSIGYVVDVYRKDSPAANSFLDYLLFISFFPTIAAGPILRGRQLLPQFRGPRRLGVDQGSRALFLITLGLIKKIAIADYLSANIVDRVFDFPGRFSSLEVLVAIYAYALQIYLDFSGYSDIAIGSAMLLGFELPENFNAPYRARNLADFWRRWHITFSTWLRDYVFFSMVGKRARNRWVLYAGLIVTMVLGGLWHGAGYTFLAWGILHGIGLAVHHGYADLRRVLARRRNATGAAIGVTRHQLLTRCSAAVAVIVTFHFICLTWVFFRAESIGQAADVLRQLEKLTLNTANLTGATLLLIGIGFLAHWSPRKLAETACGGFARLPALAQAALLFGIGMGLYYAASTDVAPFIYSRF